MMRPICLIAAAALCAAADRAAPALAQGPSQKWIVVVDAGHGGDSPGMRARLPGGATIDEKTITLGIAHKLAAELRERGVIVKMTRETDVSVPLEQRGRIANKANGHLFISIHVNAAGPAERVPRSVRGVETFFLAEAKTEDERRVEAMENEVVRFETAVEVKADDPLSFLKNDLAQNEHLRESSELAAVIQAELGASHPGPSRGVKQANFSVLRNAYMPAVLVETGFGSNTAEAAWLSSKSGQRELADGIADATMAYLERYEKRVRPPAQHR